MMGMIQRNGAIACFIGGLRKGSLRNWSVGLEIRHEQKDSVYDDPAHGLCIVVRQIKRCSERHIKYCCLRSIAGESGRLFLVDSARFLLPKHHHAKYMVVQS